MTKLRRTTLSDIARETGLSVSSVSRALRNSHQISEDQKRIVQEAARRLDYRTHLRRPSPAFLTISVFAGDVDLNAEDSAYKDIYDAIRDEAKAHRCRVVPVSLEDIDRQLADPQIRYETLILLGFDRAEYYAPLAATGCPTVLVNAQDPFGRLDSVLPDNLGCGVLVAQHLQDRGLRNTLHIVHRQRLTHKRRLDGYFEKRTGTPDATDQIIDPGSFEEVDADSIRATIAAELATTDCSKFDSVVCWGILMRRSFDAVAPQRLRGLHIVSVDHSEEIEALQSGGAIVRIPGSEIGRLAVQQLVVRQFYPDAPCVRALISVSVTELRKICVKDG